jgi:hypothetical protein
MELLLKKLGKITNKCIDFENHVRQNILKINP